MRTLRTRPSQSLATRAAKKRAVATIMLKDEQANQKACGGNGQDQSEPPPRGDAPQHRGADGQEWQERADQLDHRTGDHRLAIERAVARELAHGGFECRALERGVAERRRQGAGIALGQRTAVWVRRARHRGAPVREIARSGRTGIARRLDFQTSRGACPARREQTLPAAERGGSNSQPCITRPQACGKVWTTLADCKVPGHTIRASSWDHVRAKCRMRGLGRIRADWLRSARAWPPERRIGTNMLRAMQVAKAGSAGEKLCSVRPATLCPMVGTFRKKIPSFLEPWSGSIISSPDTERRSASGFALVSVGVEGRRPKIRLLQQSKLVKSSSDEVRRSSKAREAHHGHPAEADGLSRRMREVDHPTCRIRTAIVDPNDHGTTVVAVGDPYAGAERPVTMCCGVGAGVEALAACCPPSVKARSIPGCQAPLSVRMHSGLSACTPQASGQDERGHSKDFMIHSIVFPFCFGTDRHHRGLWARIWFLYSQVQIIIYAETQICE